jgi:hypothetical protein
MHASDRISSEDVLGEPPVWASPQQQGFEDGMSLEHRRRSMECTAVGIEIVATKVQKSFSGSYTTYVVEVTSGVKKWSIERRFSDFYYLDQEIRKYNADVADVELPSLPPKNVFRSWRGDATLVEERRASLQTYLQELVAEPAVWNRNELVMFLDDEHNSLMFVWNFDKMRKMQGVINTMAAEKETTEAQLNGQLKSAHDQVLFP